MKSIIIGKGIDLKPLEESDIEKVREWRNSKEVSGHMLSQNDISKEQQINWFREISNNPTKLYFIIQSKNCKKLGVVNFSSIDCENFSAEPGLYIGNKIDRNSLFGMEAYYLLLKLGFEELNLDKVYGTVLSSNLTAIKMNKSFGFKVEKIEKDILLDDILKLELSKKIFYKSPMVIFFQSSINK